MAFQHSSTLSKSPQVPATRPGSKSSDTDELDRVTGGGPWDLSSAAPSFRKGPWRARGRQSGPLERFQGGLGRSQTPHDQPNGTKVPPRTLPSTKKHQKTTPATHLIFARGPGRPSGAAYCVFLLPFFSCFGLRKTPRAPRT